MPDIYMRESLALFTWVLEYFLPFIVLLSVIVFAHEWGHFWFARRNKVKVETFAIGFGPELFGFTDRFGTRWSFNIVPLGGYVKMLGDADATSATADAGIISQLTDEERNQTLHSKTPWQRIQVAFGGPLANFIFAILAMIILFAVYGKPITPPVVGFVEPTGIGAKHGLMANDRIVRVNDEAIYEFGEVLPFIRSGKHSELVVKVERDGKQVDLKIPLTEKVLGIKPSLAMEFKKISLSSVVPESFSTFWFMSKSIVVGLGELITGQRQGKELGGMLAIGDMASQSVKIGVGAMLWFMIIMSINLGVLNLFPIPVLDGGQILMTAIEWVIRRPIPEMVQKIVFGTGFAMVISLMIYSTWNDLMRFKIFQMIRGWLPL